MPDDWWRATHLRFADHWAAQPGQKGVKADWPATWRNWIRRAVEDYHPGKPGYKPSGRTGERRHIDHAPPADTTPPAYDPFRAGGAA